MLVGEASTLGTSILRHAKAVDAAAKTLAALPEVSGNDDNRYGTGSTALALASGQSFAVRTRRCRGWGPQVEAACECCADRGSLRLAPRRARGRLAARAARSGGAAGGGNPSLGSRARPPAARRGRRGTGAPRSGLRSRHAHGDG